MTTVDRIDIEAAITPVAMVVRTSDSTESALAAMDATSADFVPVVGVAGEFVGIVLRRGVERGCRAMGHKPDNCMVLNHLKRDVRTEAMDAMPGAWLHGPTFHEPIILLGDCGEPVGFVGAAR